MILGKRLWGLFQTGLNVGGTIHGAGLGYWHWIKWEKKKTTKSYAFISLYFLVCEMWASSLLFQHPSMGCSHHYVFPNWELKLRGIFNLPSLNSVLQGSVTAMRNVTNASCFLRETSPRVYVWMERTVTILSSHGNPLFLPPQVQ